MSRVVRWCGVIITGAITGRGGVLVTIPPRSAPDGIESVAGIDGYRGIIADNNVGRGTRKESVADEHWKCAEKLPTNVA